MLLIDISIEYIVKTHNILHGRYSITPSAAIGIRNTASRVKLLRKRLHCRSQSRTGNIALDRPFLVGDRPNKNTRMIPIAYDHSFEEIKMFSVCSKQPILIDHKHTYSIASIEKFRSCRVM